MTCRANARKGAFSGNVVQNFWKIENTGNQIDKRKWKSSAKKERKEVHENTMFTWVKGHIHKIIKPEGETGQSGHWVKEGQSDHQDEWGHRIPPLQPFALTGRDSWAGPQI